MSMMVSFVLSFFPRDVLDEILKLIESVSEDFPSYSLITATDQEYNRKSNGWSGGCRFSVRMVEKIHLYLVVV